MTLEGSVIQTSPAQGSDDGNLVLIIRELGTVPGGQVRLLVAPLLVDGDYGDDGCYASVKVEFGKYGARAALDRLTSIDIEYPLTPVGSVESDDWRKIHKSVHSMLFVSHCAKDGTLPFARHSVGALEAGEVMDTLASDWLTTGPKAHRFEEEFAAFTGAKYAFAVNSATSGLHLALEAMGIGPGDKVITSPNTFTATGEVIRYLGADPVFADIDPRSFNLSPEAVARALDEHGGKVRAILPVHFAGQACDMDALLELARDNGIRVLEDAAHALPSTYQGKRIGTLGDATVFSFYATKTVATGEGGMVTTDDDSLAARIKIMRLHGIDRDVFNRHNSDKPAWFYEVVEPGFKYNMPDTAAAMGIHQLAQAEKFRKIRESIAARYDAAFKNLPVTTPHVVSRKDTHAWHLYVLQLDLERLTISRDRFIDLLADAGIGTSVHFIPLHIQPYWRNRYDLSPEDFPVALKVYERAVSLPIYTRMTSDDVDRVIEEVRRITCEFAQ